MHITAPEFDVPQEDTADVFKKKQSVCNRLLLEKVPSSSDTLELVMINNPLFQLFSY